MAKVVVYGGSNGGYAMAADLSLRGHEVAWYLRNRERHAAVYETGKLKMGGVLGMGEANLALVSDDQDTALAAGEIVLVPLPSHTHRQVIRELVPHLKDGHIVVFTPGTILSSYMAAKELRACGNRADVTFCESATLPYGTRRMGPAFVSINCAVTYNPVAALPGVRTETTAKRLQELYPTFLPAEDVLDAALNNQSPVTQPAGMVLNTGYVENVKDFHLHRDGVTPSVLRVEEAVDAERVALRRAFGYSKPDYPMKEFYRPGSTDDRALFSNVIVEVNESPDYEEFYDTYMPYEGMTHRYLLEACGEGLVFIKTLADSIELPAPISGAVIQLASIVSEIDYLKDGRTVESLGLAGRTVEEIRGELRNGLTVAG